ncbi:MAG: flagellar export protein FliJ [Gemmatimonadetes bacterium]|nr:flagellar export protein FliJ [Gemmatimonadota bacterium]
MDGFKFRLQKILELREWREREVARSLAAARQDADEARRIHEAVSAVHAAGLDRMARAHGAPGSAGQLQNLAHIIGLLQQKVETAASACAAAEARVDGEVRRLAAAVRERQLLSELRARQLVAWSAGQREAERKLMDEIALTRHTWRAGPPAQEAE